MMPTSSGAHWGREKNKLCVLRRTHCYKCPRLPRSSLPGLQSRSLGPPRGCPSPPSSNSWSLARLTCEKQTPEQRARQDRGVPAADHGEREAACWLGARALRGRRRSRPSRSPPAPAWRRESSSPCLQSRGWGWGSLLSRVR